MCAKYFAVKWKWVALGVLMFSFFSVVSAITDSTCVILDKNSKNPICMFLDSLQADIGSDCPAGECVYGVNNDGSLDCRACSGGGTGEPHLIDGDDFFYLNESYAHNLDVGITGWVNSTEYKLGINSVKYDSNGLIFQIG